MDIVNGINNIPTNKNLKITSLGTYTSDIDRTISIQTYYNGDYRSLTINNFFIKNCKAQDVRRQEGSVTSNIINSYNSTTGVLSLNKSYNEQNYHCYDIQYDLVLVTVE